MQTFEIKSLDQLGQAARTFLSMVKGNKTFAFYGPMGSGKTTLIKAICQELGTTDTITSPSFALVNEYRTRNGEVLYHLDLYRINSVDELYDLGYEEYFLGDNFVFIEWAERAHGLLPGSTVKVRIEESGNKSRLVQVDI
jgi:tRNA threonylcarbamoyladenosine biosynthesis protein TsaE